jgi:hypothetical protein
MLSSTGMTEAWAAPDTNAVRAIAAAEAASLHFMLFSLKRFGNYSRMIQRLGGVRDAARLLLMMVMTEKISAS